MAKYWELLEKRMSGMGVSSRSAKWMQPQSGGEEEPLCLQETKPSCNSKLFQRPARVSRLDTSPLHSAISFPDWSSAAKRKVYSRLWSPALSITAILGDA